MSSRIVPTPIENINPGMTLDTMAGPVRVVGVVGVGDPDRLITVVARPVGRGGACTEQSWNPGTMMRVIK